MHCNGIYQMTKICIRYIRPKQRSIAISGQHVLLAAPRYTHQRCFPELVTTTNVDKSAKHHKNNKTAQHQIWTANVAGLASSPISLSLSHPLPRHSRLLQVRKCQKFQHFQHFQHFLHCHQQAQVNATDSSGGRSGCRTWLSLHFLCYKVFSSLWWLSWWWWLLWL